MIRSTFSGFAMAQQALSANQKAIDVAGQNLSNINTVGYSRQRLDLASITPIGNSYTSSHNENKVGQGVTMTGVSQIRDPYLDIQYRNQITKVGTADATDQILESLGNIFDETETAGVRDALNDVITQMKLIASSSSSSDESLDLLVRSSFESMINIIHEKSTALSDLEEEVADKMDEVLVENVNSCLEQIAELNAAIKNSQVLGNNALELQDQRNQLIDDLATYLPIEVQYQDIASAFGGGVQELTISFKATDGTVHTLVSNDEYASLDFEVDETATPMYSLNLQGVGATTSTDIADLMENGVFKGNMDMLNKSEVFDGSDVKGIGYYEEMFDVFVSQIADTMNTLNGDPLFTTSDGSTEFTAENIQISKDWITGATTLNKSGNATAPDGDYTNILKMIDALTSDEISASVTVGGTSVNVYNGTIQGIYDGIQNVQALERRTSSTLLNSHLTVLNQITDSKDSVSSVSQDEEVMDLMRYQQSYNAASRLMTTMDEILDKLINSTGVVGR